MIEQCPQCGGLRCVPWDEITGDYCPCPTCLGMGGILRPEPLELHCTGCGEKVDYDYIEHDYSTGDPYCDVCRPDLFRKINEDDPRAER